MHPGSHPKPCIHVGVVSGDSTMVRKESNNPSNALEPPFSLRKTGGEGDLLLVRSSGMAPSPRSRRPALRHHSRVAHLIQWIKKSPPREPGEGIDFPFFDYHCRPMHLFFPFMPSGWRRVRCLGQQPVIYSLGKSPHQMKAPQTLCRFSAWFEGCFQREGGGAARLSPGTQVGSSSTSSWERKPFICSLST